MTVTGPGHAQTWERADATRSAGMAWVAVANADLATQINRSGELGARMRTQARTTVRVEISATVNPQ